MYTLQPKVKKEMEPFPRDKNVSNAQMSDVRFLPGGFGWKFKHPF